MDIDDGLTLATLVMEVLLGSGQQWVEWNSPVHSSKKTDRVGFWLDLRWGLWVSLSGRE